MCIALAAMPMIATLATVAGTAVSAVGQMQAGAQANAIAQENALQLQRQGAYRARQVRRKAEYANALAETQAASNGLGRGGSVLDIMADNAWQSEVDAFNEVRFANSQANVQRMEGQNAQTRATFGAVSTIIGGVSTLAQRGNPPFLRTAA